VQRQLEYAIVQDVRVLPNDVMCLRILLSYYIMRVISVCDKKNDTHVAQRCDVSESCFPIIMRVTKYARNMSNKTKFPSKENEGVDLRGCALQLGIGAMTGRLGSVPRTVCPRATRRRTRCWQASGVGSWCCGLGCGGT
jgi:hypothetical protein